MQRAAAIVVGFGKLGIERDGFVVTIDCGGVLLKRVEEDSAVVVGGVILRIILNCVVDQLQREGMLTDLVGDDSEQMQRYYMVRRGLKNLAVEGFGLGQTTGFVVRDCLLEQMIV